MVKLHEDLAELGMPVYIEGDAPPLDKLEDEFYTVSEDYTSNAVTADNRAREHLYEFTLKWYTKDATRVYSGLHSAITLLQSKGYDISGTGYHNGAYQGWYSRMVEVEKQENLEE